MTWSVLTTIFLVKLGHKTFSQVYDWSISMFWLWRSCTTSVVIFQPSSGAVTDWWREEKQVDSELETMNNVGTANAFSAKVWCLLVPWTKVRKEGGKEEAEGRMSWMTRYRRGKRGKEERAALMKWWLSVMFVWTCVDAAVEIMSTETHIQYLCLCVTDWQEIIPPLISKYTGIIAP